MIDEFAKQNTARGLTIEDVFKQAADELAAATDEGDNMMAALEAVVQAITESIPELDGYYVYKVIVGDRHYYPVEGTLRLLATGDLIFASALRGEGDEPTYYTVPSALRPIFYWLPSASGRAVADARIDAWRDAA